MTQTKGKGGKRKGGTLRKTTKYASRKPNAVNVEFIEVSKTPTPEAVVENPKIVKLKKSKKGKKLIVLEDISDLGSKSMSVIDNLSLSSSSKSGSKYSQQHIVTMFLQMLNTVKLYHWKTSSYAQHKATDELYSNLNSTIDSFVEIMLGKTGGRVNLTGTKSIPLLDYTDVTEFKREVEIYKDYLIGLQVDGREDTDLLNVRDEILGHLNQFTYLLTFK
jgi:hypothetical protein